MVDYQQYSILLKEYGSTSSWAIWAAPTNGNWRSKDSMSDMTPFSRTEDLLKSLNGDHIFVGLNPAVHIQMSHNPIPWENFHSGDIRRSQDYKLRFALRETKYWGAFMTDLYSEIKDTNSNSAIKKVTVSLTKESINSLLHIRSLLGGKASIIAMGSKAYAVLKNNLPNHVNLKMITHYSSYVNIEAYRDKVLKQLNEK